MRVSLFFFSMIIWMVTNAHAASMCDRKVCVNVDVVRTAEDMKKGLQGREGLKDHQGMLFVFDHDGFQRFWMKDMKFAIDMIWIDRSKRIVTIAPSREACKADPCEVYFPQKESRYVLEVPAGFSLKYHLKEGDLVKIKL